MLVVVEKHIIDMVFYKTSFSEFQELFLGAILKTIMNWISSMFQDDATYLVWAFGLILHDAGVIILPFYKCKIWVLREVKQLTQCYTAIEWKRWNLGFGLCNSRAETPKRVALKLAHQNHLSIY